MIPIKLRIWDEENETFYYSDDEDAIFTLGNGGVFDVKYLTQESGVENGEVVHRNVWDEVNGPIDIFTGRRDKNNNEIYTGDIFGRMPGVRCVVKQLEDGLFVFDFLDTRIGRKHLDYNGWCKTSASEGNIHQNPELLII